MRKLLRLREYVRVTSICLLPILFGIYSWPFQYKIRLQVDFCLIQQSCSQMKELFDDSSAYFAYLHSSKLIKDHQNVLVAEVRVHTSLHDRQQIKVFFAYVSGIKQQVQINHNHYSKCRCSCTLQEYCSTSTLQESSGIAFSEVLQSCLHTWDCFAEGNYFSYEH